MKHYNDKNVKEERSYKYDPVKDITRVFVKKGAIMYCIVMHGEVNEDNYAMKKTEYQNSCEKG